jgi:hypothetical protein
MDPASARAPDSNAPDYSQAAFPNAPLKESIDLTDPAARYQVAQATPTPQSIFNTGVQILRDTTQVVLGADPAQVAKSVGQIATLASSANTSIRNLDKAVQNLELGAPGTVKLVNDLSGVFNGTLQQVVNDPRLPSTVRNHPALTDTAKACDSFQDFTNAYTKYTNTPSGTWYNPTSWGNYGAKASAGAEVQRTWKEFNTDFDQARTHLPI